jgi:DNA-binding transcriptional LysR family regulator
VLDAHQLNVFKVAAETLNFTKTAKILHMTQPSVSQHIQALENHFNTPLFFRNGRHIELTDAGEALVPLARDMVNVSIHIDEMMKSLKGAVYGHLMVCCSTTPGKYVLPQLLARFHRRYPQVRVTCQVTAQKDAIHRLCEGEVHLALTSTPTEFPNAADFHLFLCDPLVLIAPLDHPWAERGEIDPFELLDSDFIMREDTSGTFIAVSEGLADVGINVHDFNVLLTLGNSEAIALSVQEGVGVGFVSEMVVDKLCRDKVAVIKLRGLNLCRDIYIGQQTRLPTSTAQNAFWKFIQNDFPILEGVPGFSNSE